MWWSLRAGRGRGSGGPPLTVDRRPCIREDSSGVAGEGDAVGVPWALGLADGFGGAQRQQRAESRVAQVQPAPNQEPENPGGRRTVHRRGRGGDRSFRPRRRPAHGSPIVSVDGSVTSDVQSSVAATDRKAYRFFGAYRAVGAGPDERGALPAPVRGPADAPRRRAGEGEAATSDGDVRRTWILFGDPTMRLR